MADESTGGPRPVPRLDTSVPQTARIWNHWLGGKDNYAVDREVGDQIKVAFPQIVENARLSRGFLVRSDRIERSFDGLILVKPGVVSVTR